MITKDEFAKRRQRLMASMQEGDIAILPAAPEQLRNGDVHYRYRQNSDFHYLTGFPEPEAVAVLIPGRSRGEYILFNRPRDKTQEIWHGKRVGLSAAVLEYDVDEVFPVDELDQQIPELLQGCRRVFYTLGQHPEFDHRMLQWLDDSRKKIRSGINEPRAVMNLETLIHELRLYKSEAEIALMRQVAEISAAGHMRAMRACQPGMYEYQLAAEFFYECQRQGCHSEAYGSIVAGGENTCVLHYTQNDQQLRKKELVLIDAGGELEGYAADITRTFPVDGRFTPEQQAIYELVLEAQLAGLAQVKPGVAWPEIQRVILEVITHGLCNLGILRGDAQTLIAEKAYFPFYMHNSGHWLGLDVHDAGSYKVGGQWRTLEPGMVLTVEPGIYIGPTQSVAPHWRGVGVRIEDDVLVTETGHEVLSAAVPKTVTELERIGHASRS